MLHLKNYYNFQNFWVIWLSKIKFVNKGYNSFSDGWKVFLVRNKLGNFYEGAVLSFWKDLNPALDTPDISINLGNIIEGNVHDVVWSSTGGR